MTDLFTAMDTDDDITPVLYATLTFRRTGHTHEAAQFREYQRWLTELARKTRVCIDAVAGWDPKDCHLHLEIRCPRSKRSKLLHRLKRFDNGRAWAFRHSKVVEWDEARQDNARAYIRTKHEPVMLSACSGHRCCRGGVCAHHPND